MREFVCRGMKGLGGWVGVGGGCQGLVVIAIADSGAVWQQQQQRQQQRQQQQQQQPPPQGHA